MCATYCCLGKRLGNVKWSLYHVFGVNRCAVVRNRAAVPMLIEFIKRCHKNLYFKDT